MKEITFFDGTVLRIETHVIEVLKKYRQDLSMKESGGILLGKKVADAEVYIITEITEPSKTDKAGKNYFIRNKKNAQNIIKEKWESSNGELNYLGEWHTHCEKNPAPSAVDKNLISQVINDCSNVFDKVFLLIYGNDSSIYCGIADSVIATSILYSVIMGGIK